MLLVYSVFPSSLLVYTIEKLLASTCISDDDGIDDDFFLFSKCTTTICDGRGRKCESNDVTQLTWKSDRGDFHFGWYVRYAERERDDD